MKYILSILLFMSVSLVMAQQKTDTVRIKTSAVCEMCQYTIEEDLAFEKGVKYSFLDVDTKILTVAYNPKKTDPNTIRVRVTKVGYNADSLKRDPKAYENLPFCCKDGGHGEEGHDGESEHHKKNN